MVWGEELMSQMWIDASEYSHEKFDLRQRTEGPDPLTPPHIEGRESPSEPWWRWEQSSNDENMKVIFSLNEWIYIFTASSRAKEDWDSNMN